MSYWVAFYYLYQTEAPEFSVSIIYQLIHGVDISGFCYRIVQQQNCEYTYYMLSVLLT